jgi:hypothetical protein
LSTLHFSFVDVDGRPHLSASATLVRLLINVSIHSYTLHCGSQFSMDLCPFHSFRHKNARLHVDCPCCKPVVNQSFLRHAHSVQTDYS